MAASGNVWRRVGSDVHLTVRVTPKSSRDAVDGFAATTMGEGTALKVFVRAVPDNGAANSAVCHVVATWLGVPKSAVSLDIGSKSRVKTLRISGTAGDLERRLDDRLAELGPTRSTQD